MADAYYLTEQDVRRLRGVLDWLDANGGSLGWTMRRRELPRPGPSYGGWSGPSITACSSGSWTTIRSTAGSVNYPCSNSTADVIPDAPAGQIELFNGGTYRIHGHVTCESTATAPRKFAMRLMVIYGTTGQIGEEMESHTLYRSSDGQQMPGYAGLTGTVTTTGGSVVAVQVQGGNIHATHVSIEAGRV